MRALLAFLLLTVSASAADTTPFARMGDPNFLSATTTAQQFQIAQPNNTTVSLLGLVTLNIIPNTKAGAGAVVLLEAICN